MGPRVQCIIVLLTLCLFEGAALLAAPTMSEWTPPWADRATVSLNVPEGYLLLNGNEAPDGRVPAGTHDLEIGLADATLNLNLEVSSDMDIEVDSAPIALEKIGDKHVAKAMDISLSGVADTLITLTMSYTDEELAALNILEESLTIYHYKDDIWTRMPSIVDKENNIVTCSVNGLSPFALAGDLISGEATSLRIIGNYDSAIRPNQTFTVSGAAYYNNNTFSPTTITVNITVNGNSTIKQTDDYGNFRFDLTAPTTTGIYTVNVTANSSAPTFQNSTTMTLNVTLDPLFRASVNNLLINDDATNSTVEYDFPYDAVADNSTIYIEADQMLTGNKTYLTIKEQTIYALAGENATGNFTFTVGNLSSATTTDARLFIYTEYISGLGANVYFDSCIDGIDLDEDSGAESHNFQKSEPSTWDWSYNVTPHINFSYLQEVVICNATQGTDLYINFTADTVINFTATAPVLENLTYKLNNMEFLSQTGIFSNALRSITGHLQNGTNFLDFNSTSAGGFNYTINTTFHTIRNASVTQHGRNYSAEITVENTGEADWQYPTVYYYVPQGGYNISVYDKDNSSQNITASCTIPADGGQLIIPPPEIGTVYFKNTSINNITRNFEINYSLYALEPAPTLEKERYVPGDTVNLTINVTYKGQQTNATVTVNLTDPDGNKTLEDAVPTQNGTGIYTINYTLTSGALPGAYTFDVLAEKDMDYVSRATARTKEFEVRELRVVIQAGGPYKLYRNASIYGKAYYTSSDKAGNLPINITIVGNLTTNTTTDTDGGFNLTYETNKTGDYTIYANATDSDGLSDSHIDTFTVTDDPFYIVYDIESNIASGDLFLNNNNTFNITIPDCADVYDSHLTLTGKNNRSNYTNTTDNPPAIPGQLLNTSAGGNISGNFSFATYPFQSINVDYAELSVSWERSGGSCVATVGTYLDDVEVGNTVDLSASSGTYVKEVTSMIVPDSLNQTVKIHNLWQCSDTSYVIVAEVDINYTGIVEVPHNLEVYEGDHIIYTSTGDYGTENTTTIDIEKYAANGNNTIMVKSSRASYVTYHVNFTMRDWDPVNTTTTQTDYTIETNATINATPCGTDEDWESPEITYPLPTLVRNVTVYDLDNGTNITANCTIVNMSNLTDADKRVVIPPSVVGVVEYGYARIFNVSYIEERLNFTLTKWNDTYNPSNILNVTANVTHDYSPVTDATVKATVSNSTWGEAFYLAYSGSGIYENASYALPPTLGAGTYNLSVRAVDPAGRERIMLTNFTVRTLTVTAVLESTYMVNDTVQINGEVNDTGTVTPITNGNVTITIYNSTGAAVNTSNVTISSGTYTFSRVTDGADRYNVSIVAQDNESINGSVNVSYLVSYNVTADVNDEYNQNDSVTINVTVADKASLTTGASVTINVTLSNTTVESYSTAGGDVSDNGDGNYTLTFNETQPFGIYLVDITVTTAKSNGTASGNFRVIDFAASMYTDKSVYIAGENVTVYGRAMDANRSAGLVNTEVNLSLYNSTGFVQNYSVLTGYENFIIISDDGGYIYSAEFDSSGFSSIKQVDDIGNQDRGVAIADFNNDGIQDFVSGDGDTGNLYLYTNLGNNTFGTESYIGNISASGWIYDMAVGDFNNDGNHDFIVGGFNDDLYIYKGNGDGTFTNATITDDAPGVTGMGKDAGDINEDGNLDFLYAANNGTLNAYYGAGDGTFASASRIGNIDIGTDPYGAALADFDGDGHLDIVANNDGGDHNFYKGYGNGTFTYKWQAFDTNDWGAIDAFDFDGDQDVVYTTITDYKVYLRTGNGNGTFGGATLIGTLPNSYNALGISAPMTGYYLLTLEGVKAYLGYEANLSSRYIDRTVLNQSVFDVRYNTTVEVSKSEYSAGETVHINTTVLDADGSGVPDVNVTVNVTHPDGNITNFTTMDNNITYLGSGIYSCNISSIWQFVDTTAYDASAIAVTEVSNGSASKSFNVNKITVDITTDKSEYSSGEKIYINTTVLHSNGTAEPNANVTVNVTHPDTSVTTFTTMDANNGNITYIGGGIYSCNLSSTSQYGEYNMTTVVVTGVSNGSNATSVLVRKIIVNVEAADNLYDVDEKVIITGNITDQDENLVAANLTITIYNATMGQINETNISVDSNGTYEYNYTLDIQATAGNHTIYSNATRMGIIGSNSTWFEVELVEIIFANRTEYNPGDHIGINIEIRNGSGTLQGAEVNISVDNGTQVVFNSDCTTNSTGGCGFNFTLPGDAALGPYTIRLNSTKGSVVRGFNTSSFTARSLNVTLGYFDPYNVREWNLSPTAIKEILLAGLVKDKRLGSLISGAQVNASVYTPSGALFSSIQLVANSSGQYLANFTSDFTGDSNSGYYNVTIIGNDSEIFGNITGQLYVCTVQETWFDRSYDYRFPVLVRNDNRTASKSYSGTKFGLDLPGGVNQSTLTVRNLTGDVVPTTTNWINDTAVNITLSSGSLGIYQERVIYVFFERPTIGGSNITSYWLISTASNISVAAGNQEGYNAFITTDKNLYFAGQTVWINTTFYPLGSALSFDGGDDYISVSDSASLDDVANEITISAWAKPSRTYQSEPSQWYYLTYRSGIQYEFGYEGWTDALAFKPYNSTGSEFTVSEIMALNKDQWYFIAATIDSSGNVKLYVNDTLVASRSDFTGNLMAGGNIGMGSNHLGSAGYLNATIDDVHIYNRSLNATDIGELYDGTYSNTSGLVGYWRFEEGTGTSASDSSGNGNHGTLGGDGQGTDIPSWTFDRPPINATPAFLAANVSIYYPNATSAQNYTEQTPDANGAVTVTYLAGATNGVYTINVTSETANGIPRFESKQFRIGSLRLNITKNASIINVCDHLSIGVNVSNTTDMPVENASVTLYIKNPSDTEVYQDNDNSSAEGNITFTWNTPCDSTIGIYTIEAYADTANNSGFNETSVNVWNLTAAVTSDKAVYDVGEEIIMSGKVQNNGTEVEAALNLTVTNSTGDIFYTNETTSSTAAGDYSYNITLPQTGNYTATIVANYSNISGTDAVNFTVRDLAVTVTSASSYMPGTGTVLITGTVKDSVTAAAIGNATVTVVTYTPQGVVYDNTTLNTTASGAYTVSYVAHMVTGTYQVNVSAVDSYNVNGTASTTYKVNLTVDVLPVKYQHKPGETAAITLNITRNVTKVENFEDINSDITTSGDGRVTLDGYAVEGNLSARVSQAFDLGQGISLEKTASFNGYDGFSMQVYSDYTQRAADWLVATVDDEGKVYVATFNGSFKQLGVSFDKYLQGVEVADFDNDGDYDFVTGDGFYGDLYLFTNNDGDFTKSRIGSFTTNSYLKDMAAGDFNNDGNYDFIVGGNNNDIYLYTGDGRGGFIETNITLSATSNGRGKDAGDINEDGNLDLLYAGTDGLFYAYYGNGNGTFGTETWLNSIADIGTDPYGVTLADFDGDGHLDIVANNNGGDHNFYTGDGTGTFTNKWKAFDTAISGAIDAFDFNFDGNQDLVLANYTNKRVYYFLGHGNGTFGSPLQIGTTTYNTLGISAPSHTILQTVSDDMRLIVQANDSTGWHTGYNDTIANGWNLIEAPFSSFGLDTDTANKINITLAPESDTEIYPEVLFDDLKFYRDSNPYAVSGASLTVVVGAPDGTEYTYSTPTNITNNNDGSYSLNFGNTSIEGLYSINASATNDTNGGIGRGYLAVRSFNMTVNDTSKELTDDSKVTGTVIDSITGGAAYSNITVNLTYPDDNSTIINTMTGRYGRYNAHIPSPVLAGTYNISANTSSGGIEGNVSSNLTINLFVDMTARSNLSATESNEESVMNVTVYDRKWHEGGLVGHWGFDNNISAHEGGATHFGNTKMLLRFDDGLYTVNDSSAYSATATSSGATWVSSGCVYGGCVNFSGGTEYIDVTPTAFNLTQYTISAWVYPINKSVQGIIRLYNGTNYLRLFISTTEKFEHDIAPGEIGNIQSSFNTDEWAFITATFNGTTTKIYKNGTLQAQTDANMTFPNVNNVDISWGNYFNGTIDEVAIYSVALNDTEIMEDYNAGKVIFTDHVPGKVNDSITFDGIDDYVEATDSAELNPRAAITVEAWFNISSLDSSWRTIAAKYPAFSLAQSADNRIRAMINTSDDGPTYLWFDSPIANQWTHAALTYDGASFTLYINGSSVASTSATGHLQTAGTNFYIGSANTSEQYFNGPIDEVRIYSMALSASHIAEHSNVTYHDTPIYNNVSGADVNLTITKGRALFFDGDDYVEVPDDPSLNVTSAVTISMWIKPACLPSDMASTSPGIFNSTAWKMYFSKSDENLVIRWENETDAFGGNNIGPFDKDNWYHIVVTHDGTELRGYINGQLDFNAGYSQTHILKGNKDSYQIGRTNSSNYFNGTIDEVRIFTKVLNASEIYTLYNASYNITGDIAGRWDFDESIGTTANDVGDYDNHGTLGGDGAGSDVPTWTSDTAPLGGIRNGTTGANGVMDFTFRVPSDYVDYRISVEGQSTKYGQITRGNASDEIYVGYIVIFPERAEFMVGDPTWATSQDIDKVPEDARQLLVDVALLDPGGHPVMGKAPAVKIVKSTGETLSTLSLIDHYKLEGFESLSDVNITNSTAGDSGTPSISSTSIRGENSTKVAYTLQANPETWAYADLRINISALPTGYDGLSLYVYPGQYNYYSRMRMLVNSSTGLAESFNASKLDWNGEWRRLYFPFTNFSENIDAPTVNYIIVRVQTDRTYSQSLTYYFDDLRIQKRDGYYMGNYTFSALEEEGQYTIKPIDYTGRSKSVSVAVWGCARCHVDWATTNIDHYNEWCCSCCGPFGYTISERGPGASPDLYFHGLTADGGYYSDPVTPSNWTPEFVHDTHQTISMAVMECGNNGNSPHRLGSFDDKCKECHFDAMRPVTCPECHSSADYPTQNLLYERYGLDMHEGVNVDAAQDKPTKTTSGSGAAAVDNDEETAWEPSTTTASIEIDFGANYTADGIRITHDNYKIDYEIRVYNGSWGLLMDNESYRKEAWLNFTAMNISKVNVTVTGYELTIGTDTYIKTFSSHVSQAANPTINTISVFEVLPSSVTNTSHIMCANCHGDLESRGGPGPSVKPDCQDCHPRPTSTVDTVPGGMSNGSHSPEEDVACGTCHSIEHDIMAVTTTEEYTCIECHQSQKHGNVTATKSNCVEAGCHNETGNGDDFYLNESTNVTIQMEKGMTYDCGACHKADEPHFKHWTYICQDCHHDFDHGNTSGLTEREKAYNCLKCHGSPHEIGFQLPTCTGCHGGKIHGRDNMVYTYNESEDIDCLRCHGSTVNDSLPLIEGHPGMIILNQSLGYNYTDCAVCHDNGTMAYQLHNGTFNTSNASLLQDIENYNISVCIDCHDPIPNRTIDTDRDELLGEPWAPHTPGHGNLSCFACHGHSPSELTYSNDDPANQIYSGYNCTGCHQDPVKIANVITWYNDTGLLVNFTAGEHGNVSCTVCHGHTPSGMSNTGNNNEDCKSCHWNGSHDNYSFHNGTEASPTQVGGHNDWDDCIYCHGHTPLGMTFFAECEDCHKNVSRAEEINDTDGYYAPQAVGHGNLTCDACHGHNPTDITTEGNDTDACLSCHRDNASKANYTNVTYGIYPPQTQGHGKLNNTVNCSVCHGHNAVSMTHTSNCTACHDNSSAECYPVENGSCMTPLQVGGHGLVNCTECHGHTPSEFAGVTPRTNCSECHMNTSAGNFGMWNGSNTTAPQTMGHGSANCSICHSHRLDMTFFGNTTSECKKCHTPYNITVQDIADYNSALLNFTVGWIDQSWAKYVNDTYEPHVVPRQALGHGNASHRGEPNCTVCHGHTPYNFSSMTVEANCTECHQNNNSDQPVPISNGSFVAPLQVVDHGDIICEDCHSHNASNLIYKEDCTECHSGKAHGVLDTTPECQACHGHETMGITYLSDCRDCHNNIEEAESFNITSGTYPRFVYGHASRTNYSAYLNCTYCHGHEPVNLMFKNQETECRDCHINETTPTWQPPVPPAGIQEDFGHANMHCKWCHNHTPQGMTKVGVADCVGCHEVDHMPIAGYNTSNYSNWSDDTCYSCHVNVTGTNKTDQVWYSRIHYEGADCKGCHLDVTGTNKSISGWENGTYYNCTSCHNGTSGMSLRNATNWSTSVIAPNESVTHGNATHKVFCLECHPPHVDPDTLENKSCSDSCHAGEQDKEHTREVNCTYCHINSSASVRIYDLSSNDSATILPTQIEGTHNAEFESNTNGSNHTCAWCHFRMSNFTYTNVTITNLTGQNENLSVYPNIHYIYTPERCQECHLEPAVHPLKGAAYDDKNISECEACHSVTHDVLQGGGPDCISCHDVGGDSPKVQVAAMNATNSIHANLNANATNATTNNSDNKMCWGCHQSDGSEPQAAHPDRLTNPYQCYECHNATAKPYENASNAPNVTEHFLNGVDIQAAATQSNVTESCIACHNATEMLVSYTEPDGNNNTPLAIVSHYGKSRASELVAAGATDCSYCHQNTSTAFAATMTDNATYHSSMANHTPRSTGPSCTNSTCHSTGRIHDSSLEKPAMYNDSFCQVCHPEKVTHASSDLPGVSDTNDLNCTDCHTNSQSNEKHIHGTNTTYLQQDGAYGANTTAANCTSCHLGTTITSINGTTPPQVSTEFAHSSDPHAGTKWGSYWDNESLLTSCEYCHGTTEHNATPLGKVVFIQGNETVNSAVGGTYWCANCHWNQTTYYAAGNYTPVPPEITNTSLNASDTTLFVDHTPYGKTDLECAACHTRTSLVGIDTLMHNIGEGGAGPNCIACHDNSGGKPKIDAPIVDAARHSELNSDAVATVDEDNKPCWACHANGTQPEEGQHPENMSNALRCANCHGTGNYGAISHTTDSCTNCHNDLVKASEVDAFNTTNSLMSHYGKSITHTSSDDSPSSGPSGGTDIPEQTERCVHCHDKTMHLGTVACEQCHPEYSTNHGSPMGDRAKDCDACHAGVHKTLAPSHRDGCDQCHTEVSTDLIYRTNSEMQHKLKPSPDTPQQKPCEDCHTTIEHHGGETCASCHLGDYYGQNAADMTCEECHERGKVDINIVEDAERNEYYLCQRCHPLEREGGYVHEWHQDEDLDCEDCHKSHKPGSEVQCGDCHTHGGDSDDTLPHMECSDCHEHYRPLKMDIQSCGKCHGENRLLSLHERFIRGADCGGCHKFDLHSIHSVNIYCMECHISKTEISHGEKVLDPGKECEKCHEVSSSPKPEGGCSNCHEEQKRKHCPNCHGGKLNETIEPYKPLMLKDVVVTGDSARLYFKAYSNDILTNAFVTVGRTSYFLSAIENVTRKPISDTYLEEPYRIDIRGAAKFYPYSTRSIEVPIESLSDTGKLSYTYDKIIKVTDYIDVPVPLTSSKINDGEVETDVAIVYGANAYSSTDKDAAEQIRDEFPKDIHRVTWSTVEPQTYRSEGTGSGITLFLNADTEEQSTIKTRLWDIFDMREFDIEDVGTEKLDLPEIYDKSGGAEVKHHEAIIYDHDQNRTRYYTFKINTDTDANTTAEAYAEGDKIMILGRPYYLVRSDNRLDRITIGDEVFRGEVTTDEPILYKSMQIEIVAKGGKRYIQFHDSYSLVKKEIQTVEPIYFKDIAVRVKETNSVTELRIYNNLTDIRNGGSFEGLKVDWKKVDHNSVFVSYSGEGDIIVNKENYNRVAQYGAIYGLRLKGGANNVGTNIYFDSSAMVFNTKDYRTYRDEIQNRDIKVMTDREFDPATISASHVYIVGGPAVNEEWDWLTDVLEDKGMPVFNLNLSESEWYTLNNYKPYLRKSFIVNGTVYTTCAGVNRNGTYRSVFGSNNQN